MTLSDTDRVALCQHLATRFPGFADRARIAADAGLAEVQLTGDPLTVWGDVVVAAERAEAVARLVRAASLLRPDDALLAELARDLAEGRLKVPPADDPKVWLRNTAIAGAVVVVLGVLALVGDSMMPPAATTSAAEAPQEQPAEPAPAEVQPPPAVVPEVADTDAATGVVDAAPDEVLADTDAPAEQAAPTGPCAGPPGSVVGYAYAGRNAPSGSTWTVPRGLNVRADYPRRDNGWNARAPVVCVLSKGMTVKLDVDPIAVDGGVWWVPISADGVQR